MTSEASWVLLKITEYTIDDLVALSGREWFWCNNFKLGVLNMQTAGLNNDSGSNSRAI
jgi:hypothetical protein